MIEKGTGFDVCPDGRGSFYIRNTAALAEILEYIRDGHYCTVLGPRYCQKSLLLSDVRTALGKTHEQECVLIDLRELAKSSDDDFLADLSAKIGDQVNVRPGVVKDERSFQQSLKTVVEALGRDLVLLLDHLERIRMGPLHSMLRALRALREERTQGTPHRVDVVIASSLSVAALSLGNTSPFNIARVIWVDDLDAEQSQALIEHIASQKQVQFTSTSARRLFEATQGDRYLTPALCICCAEQAMKNNASWVAEPDVQGAVEWFLAKKAGEYPPLAETIRAVESDPTTLLNAVQILKHPGIEQNKLNLDLRADVDPLVLTGGFRSQGGEITTYAARNELFQRYLETYWHAYRVAQVLSVAGEWDNAIQYLHEATSANQQYQPALLGAIIDAIYAAPAECKAYEQLAQRLSRTFGIPRIAIYVIDSIRAHLKPVSQAGSAEWQPSDISLDEEERLEVQAYFGTHYHAARGESGEPVLYFPLEKDDQTRFGLAVVHGIETDPQAESFLGFVSFLKQVGRAMATVMDRERKVQQLTTLYEQGQLTTRSLDLDGVLQTTIEAAVKAVPAAQKGSLFFWDEARQKLIIRAQVGFRSDLADALQLSPGEGIAGWVYTNRKPVLLPRLLDDSRTKKIDLPDVMKAKSGIAVPLEAWDRVMGVLCLDNVTAYNAFSKSDVDLSLAFCGQASMAIQNALLHTELYNLGMDINRGALGPAEIFRRTLESIIRVSDADAGNMYLFEDTSDPRVALGRPPILQISLGLSDEIDGKITPRPNGLTYRTLVTGKAAFVRCPDDLPGINPLAHAAGVQASVCLPMKIKDQVIGVLFVYYRKPHMPSVVEIRMLALFANQAALAIENKRLLDQLKIQLANIAHMTKTPLYSLSMLIDQLYRQTHASKREQSYRAVKSTLADLSASIEGILTVWKHEQGTLRPDFQLFDVNLLLDNVIDLFSLEAQDKGGHLGKVRADGPVWAWGDPVLVMVVLHNLVKNALGSFPPGHTREKAVTIQAEHQTECVILSVTDTGAGISPEDQQRVFDAYFSRSNRTGLGLHISRTIARLHGTDLVLQSQVGKGSTFRLTLPRAAKED